MLNRILVVALISAASLQCIAQPAAEGEKILTSVMPQCYEATVKRSGYAGKLPAGWSAEQITLESTDPYCRFDSALVKLADGRWYVGGPWPLAGQRGTPAEKLKAFAWERMNESFLAESAGKDGSLEKLVVRHVTSAGRVTLEGHTDTAGTLFMMGDVAATADELVKKRNARLASVLDRSPSRGPKDAPIRIVEFSDFQCPSCKDAHGFIPRILDGLKGNVSYTRVDLPLVSNHPWSFAASVIGRAIHRQKPAVFWDWKDAVYANQADLNPFTIDQFGRNFAEDHGIDMAKYDADVVSDGIRKEILDGIGAAYTIHVNATPSFLVNDRFVASGMNGKNLEKYLTDLMKR